MEIHYSGFQHLHGLLREAAWGEREKRILSFFNPKSKKKQKNNSVLFSTAGVSSRISWLCVDMLPSYFGPGGCCLQKTQNHRRNFILLLPYYYRFKVRCITYTASLLVQAQAINSWLEVACLSTQSNKHRDTLTLKSGSRGWVTQTGTAEDGARGWTGLCVYLQNYSL